MSFGIIDAIKINRIINPPTNTKNNLNPIHADIVYLDIIIAIIEVKMIKNKIIVLGLFQLIKFIAIIVIREIKVIFSIAK